jgi:phage-related minor tail protein
MSFPWDKVNADIQTLSQHHPHDPVVGGTKARVDAVLVEHLSQTVDQLGEVIGASANQVARGTNVIKDAIEKFQSSAVASTEKLCSSLDSFRESMDKSSKVMARLTLLLVVFTAILAVFTAVLAFR